MHEAAWNRLIEEVRSWTTGIREQAVMTSAGAEEVRHSIGERYDFAEPRPLEALVGEVAEMLRRWSVHVTHPRYFGLFNPNPRQAGMLGDALAAVYNPQLAAWSHSPAVNELERHTLRQLTRVLGQDPDSCAANFTSGGAEANHSALLVALEHRFPACAKQGLASLGVRPAVYVTEDTHHSFVKIVRMSGLGTGCLRRIALDSRLAMDVRALRQAIEEDRRQGWHPLLIVGTAGTTSAGIVDPLDEMADVAEEQGAWFHVDGAWGASAMLSPRWRGELRGIERADSITWDAHKWLSVPMGAGMFFCRHREAVRGAFSVATSYMPDRVGEDVEDPYSTTMQWSRRAIGLKVFMALAELGLGGYAELIDHQVQMGERLREKLADAGWRVLNDTRLPVVCFDGQAGAKAPPVLSPTTKPPTTEPSAAAPSLSGVLAEIYRRRRVWISEVRLGGQPALRACITSYQTQEEDLDVLIEELRLARLAV